MCALNQEEPVVVDPSINCDLRMQKRYSGSGAAIEYAVLHLKVIQRVVSVLFLIYILFGFISERTCLLGKIQLPLDLLREDIIIFCPGGEHSGDWPQLLWWDQGAHVHPRGWDYHNVRNLIAAGLHLMEISLNNY